MAEVVAFDGGNMGPLFVGIALLALCCPVILLTFLVARLFTRTRVALTFALVVVAAGVMGSIVGLFLQVPFLHVKNEVLQGSPVTYLAVAFGIGLLAASCAGAAFTVLLRRVTNRG